MKKSNHLDKCLICTRKQRIGFFMAFVGVFVCGVMLGLGGGPKVVKVNRQVVSEFTSSQCSDIRYRISANHYEDADVLAQMYQIYNENCVGREFDEPVAQPKPATPQKTCVQIEKLLLERMWDEPGNYDAHIQNAKVYAQISERGCPENAEKYELMAKQELEIARALADDRFDEVQTIDVVETYKRLDMQAAAEEIFETAKKLTNPAIDFILEVEKIINEKQ